MVKNLGLQQRANVTVIAATNRPDKIDPALLRPGTTSLSFMCKFEWLCIYLFHKVDKPPDNSVEYLVGRFDRVLYVGPPSASDREDIFRIHLRKMPCAPDVCIEELATLTEGSTGADISLICREAALAAIEVCLLTIVIIDYLFFLLD